MKALVYSGTHDEEEKETEKIEEKKKRKRREREIPWVEKLQCNDR